MIGICLSGCLVVEGEFLTERWADSHGDTENTEMRVLTETRRAQRWDGKGLEMELR